MAKARVELNGCLTHTSRGRTFRKGQPQIITNAADIMYYQSQADFAVAILDDDAPAKAKATAPKPAPAPEPDADDEGDDEGGEESTSPAAPAKPTKPAKTKAK